MSRQFQIGDSIPNLYPSNYTKGQIMEDVRLQNPRLRSRLDPSPVEAVVEYIHPEGRFLTVRFLYDSGSFCESKQMLEGKIQY